jgi:hypothetical protein
MAIDNIMLKKQKPLKHKYRFSISGKALNSLMISLNDFLNPKIIYRKGKKRLKKA